METATSDAERFELGRQWKPGVQVVWDVDAKSKTVAVFRPDRETELFREGDSLTEGLLLPGFTISVQDLFAWK